MALARALAIHPRVLLLDEPLSNLDAALRQDMAREIRILQQRGGITTIMVTHDQTEAMALADRLVLMHDGKVQQIGRPRTCISRPANPFVARFIGGSNIVAGGSMRHAARAARRRPPIALAAVVSPDRGGDARGAARQHPARRARPARPRRRHGRIVHLARRDDGACRAPRPDDDDPDPRPRPWPDAAPRHRGRQQVTLHWSAEDEFLFDADDRAMPAEPASSSRPKGDPIMSDRTISRRAVPRRHCPDRPMLAAPAVLTRRARGGGTCVVGTWGGDYARLLRENIDDPILKPAGINVIQDVGDETPRYAKMAAQKTLPRGTMDIACFGARQRLPRHRGRPGGDARRERKCRT